MSIILYDVCYDERLQVYRDKLDVRLLIFYNVCNKEYGMKGEISKLIKKDEYISLQSMWRCDVGLSSIFPPLTGCLVPFPGHLHGEGGRRGRTGGLCSEGDQRHAHRSADSLARPRPHQAGLDAHPRDRRVSGKSESVLKSPRRVWLPIRVWFSFVNLSPFFSFSFFLVLFIVFFWYFCGQIYWFYSLSFIFTRIFHS